MSTSFKKISFGAFALSAALCAQVATASAGQTSSNTVQIDKFDLTRHGYVCKSSYTHPGLSVCKKGSTTYYCKDSKCVKQAAQLQNGRLVTTLTAHTASAKFKKMKSPTRRIFRSGRVFGLGR